MSSKPVGPRAEERIRRLNCSPAVMSRVLFMLMISSLLVLCAACSEATATSSERERATPGPISERAVPSSTAFSNSLQHPSFLAGWYTGGKNRSHGLQAYRRVGANLVVTAPGGPAYTTRWLREARRASIRLLLQPDPTWIRDGKLDRLTSFVRRYRDNPAVYGWYLYDEPDFNGLAPSKLVTAYRAVKEVDKRRPVAVIFASGQCRFGRQSINPDYLRGFDLLMFDRYPFYDHTQGARAVADIRRVSRNCVSSARRQKKLGPLMVLQAFGKGVRDGPFAWRDPTFAETLCSARVAKEAGALGVLFYADQFADPSLWFHVQSTIHSVRSSSGTTRRRAAVGLHC